LQILNTIPDDEKMLGRSRPRTALRAFPVDHANNPLTDTLRALIYLHYVYFSRGMLIVLALIGVYSGASVQRSSHIRPSNPMGFGHLVK